MAIYRSHVNQHGVLPTLAAKSLTAYEDYLRDPVSDIGLLGLAEAFLLNGAPDKAKVFLTMLLKVKRSDSKTELRCGELALQMSMLEDAFGCFVQASRDEVTKAEACLHLAGLLVKIGEIDAGLRMLESASAAHTEESSFAVHAADVLLQAGRPAEALHWGRTGHRLARCGRSAKLLSQALYESGSSDEAIDLLEDWLQEHPTELEAYLTLTGALMRPGEYERCKAWCEQGLLLFPKSAALHFHRAWALLSLARWETGWKEYEWRWGLDKNAYARRFLHPFNLQEWRSGDPIRGSTVFVHAEQGHGDIFMFMGLLPRLREHFEVIIIGVYRELLQLMEELHVADEVVQLDAALPYYDHHVAFGSLPLALELYDTELLRATSSPILKLAKKYSCSKPHGKPRIGLVWGGTCLGPYDRRGIPETVLAEFLSQDHGVQFVLLQQGLRSVMAPQTVGSGVDTVDMREQLGDWCETAQALLQLDGLLSADTGVAHLAGRLGIATAVILPPSPDWRWVDPQVIPECSENTLWYKTVKLFRCKAQSDCGRELLNAIAFLKGFAAEQEKTT